MLCNRHHTPWHTTSQLLCGSTIQLYIGEHFHATLDQLTGWLLSRHKQGLTEPGPEKAHRNHVAEKRKARARPQRNHAADQSNRTQTAQQSYLQITAEAKMHNACVCWVFTLSTVVTAAGELNNHKTTSRCCFKHNSCKQQKHSRRSSGHSLVRAASPAAQTHPARHRP